MTANKVYEEGGAWSSGAGQYASGMEKFTLQAVNRLLKHTSAVAPFGDASTTRVLDNGCGSGSVSMALSALSPSTPILATDIAESMLDLVKAKDLPNVRTRTADALDLKSLGEDGQDGMYSHVLSTFMIQFVPSVTQAVKEMLRVLRPGGALGLGTWGNLDFPALVVKAGLKLDPDWKPDWPFSEEWPIDEVAIQNRLQDYGFTDVNVETVRMEFGMNREQLKTYAFESKNPAAETILAYWRSNGRLAELQAEVAKCIDEWDDLRTFGAEGIIAVARKP